MNEKKKLYRRNDKLIEREYLKLKTKYPKYEENFDKFDIVSSDKWSALNVQLIKVFKKLRVHLTLQARDVVDELEPIIKQLSEL